jgi:hypothetical protein
MHAVVRSYSGAGAKELMDILEERKAEFESIVRAVTGFVAYSLIRTRDGGLSITVCEDETGTDQSIEFARDWVRKNAADLGSSPLVANLSLAVVTEGSVIIHAS